MGAVMDAIYAIALPVIAAGIALYVFINWDDWKD